MFNRSAALVLTRAVLTDDIEAISGGMEREWWNVMRIKAEFVSFTDNSIGHLLYVNWMILQ